MDIIGLLDARGINWVPLGSDEVAIVCPNAASHEGGNDGKPSFNINTAGRGGHCFACGFSLKAEKLPKWLAGEDLDDLEMKSMTLRAQLRRLSENQADSLFKETLDVYMPRGEPWGTDQFRGISLQTYKDLGATYVTRGRYENRIAFPIYLNGELIGVDARALLPNMEPKYLRNYKSTCRENWLYPYDIIKAQQPKLLLLGEGILHAVNAYDKGFPALCFFGSNNWSKNKLRMLLATGAEEICFFRDRDKAGLRAEQLICTELADYFTVSSACYEDIAEGKDMGDLTQEEMAFAVDNRSKARVPLCLLGGGDHRDIKVNSDCRRKACPYNFNCSCLNTAWT